MGNSEIAWDKKKYIIDEEPKKIIMKSINNLNKFVYLYPLNYKDEENMMAQLNLYCLRKKRSKCNHIVQVLDIFHENSFMSCASKPYNLSIIIEPIPWILHDQKYQVLSFKEILFLIEGCFIGFIQLEAILKIDFTITDRMIGINQQCYVKVWFNQNFLSNEPQFVPQKRNKRFKLYIQILKVLEPYCYQLESFQNLFKNIQKYVQSTIRRQDQTQLELAYHYFCEILRSMEMNRFSNKIMALTFFNNKRFSFDDIVQIPSPCHNELQVNIRPECNRNQQSQIKILDNRQTQILHFKAKPKDNIPGYVTTFREQSQECILKNSQKKNKQVKSLKSCKNSLSKLEAQQKKYFQNQLTPTYRKNNSRQNLKFLHNHVFNDNLKKVNKLQGHAPSIVALFNQDQTQQSKLNKQKSTERLKLCQKQKPLKIFLHNKKMCSSHSGNIDQICKNQNQISRKKQFKTIGPGTDSNFSRFRKQDSSGIDEESNIIGQYSQVTIEQSDSSKSQMVYPQINKDQLRQIKIKQANSHKQQSIISDLKNQEDSLISYKYQQNPVGKYAQLIGSFQYIKQKMNQNIKVCQSISSKQASLIKIKEKQPQKKSKIINFSFNDNIVQSILNQNEIRQIQEEQEDLQQNKIYQDFQPVSLRYKGSNSDQFCSTKQSFRKNYQPGFITCLNFKAKSIISQR